QPSPGAPGPLCWPRTLTCFISHGSSASPSIAPLLASTSARIPHRPVWFRHVRCRGLVLPLDETLTWLHIAPLAGSVIGVLAPLADIGAAAAADGPRDRSSHPASPSVGSNSVAPTSSQPERCSRPQHRSGPMRQARDTCK